MSAPRYFARYHGKAPIEPFEDLYEVVDSQTHLAVSPPIPYHRANDQADERNQGTFIATPVPVIAGSTPPTLYGEAGWGWTLPSDTEPTSVLAYSNSTDGPVTLTYSATTIYDAGPK